MNLKNEFLEANILTGNRGKQVNLAIHIAYVLLGIGLVVTLLLGNALAAAGLAIAVSILLGAELISVQLAAIGDANIALTLQKLNKKATNNDVP